jgi:accessory gene regulator B
MRILFIFIGSGVFMKSITSVITDILVESGTVSQEERSLYYYCVEGLVEICGNVLLTLLLGLLLGKAAETAIFLLVIVPLRSTAGGYHAESGKACFVLSLAIYLLTIWVADILSALLTPSFSLWIFTACAATILILAPVDCKNKRLSAQDKKWNRKNCRILMLATSALFAATWVLGAVSVCFLVSCCLAMIVMSLLLGIAKNRPTNLKKGDGIYEGY